MLKVGDQVQVDGFAEGDWFGKIVEVIPEIELEHFSYPEGYHMIKGPGYKVKVHWHEGPVNEVIHALAQWVKLVETRKQIPFADGADLSWEF